MGVISAYATGPAQIAVAATSARAISGSSAWSSAWSILRACCWSWCRGCGG